MISPRRLCRAADGRVVEADDPAAAFLLVCEGGVVDPADHEAVAAFLSIDVPAAEPEPAERTVTFGKAKEPEVADEPTEEEPVEDEPTEAPTAPVAKRTRKPKG